MEFSRQEYWSGVPFASQGDLPDSGIEPRSPALQTDSLLSEQQGKQWIHMVWINAKDTIDTNLNWPESVSFRRKQNKPYRYCILYPPLGVFLLQRCSLSDVGVTLAIVGLKMFLVERS